MLQCSPDQSIFLTSKWIISYSPKKYNCYHGLLFISLLLCNMLIYRNYPKYISFPARVVAKHIVASQIAKIGLYVRKHKLISFDIIKSIFCNVFLNNERNQQNFIRVEKQNASNQAVKKGKLNGSKEQILYV